MYMSTCQQTRICEWQALKIITTFQSSLYRSMCPLWGSVKLKPKYSMGMSIICSKIENLPKADG